MPSVRETVLGQDEEVVLKALRTNTAFLQREVATQVSLKYVPNSNFAPMRASTKAQDRHIVAQAARRGQDIGKDDADE